MKIYNEIIWQWNDETQKLEEVYTDSFEYNGLIDKLYGNGNGNDDDPPENTDEEYTLFYNTNIDDYKAAISTKLSGLLVPKLWEIESITGESGLEYLQKTFKSGGLKTGRKTDEIMVVYEKDKDASLGGDLLINYLAMWGNFAHPNTYEIHIDIIQELDSDGNPRQSINLILTADNGKPSLNLNSLSQQMELAEVPLITISQASNSNSFLDLVLFLSASFLFT